VQVHRMCSAVKTPEKSISRNYWFVPFCARRVSEFCILIDHYCSVYMYCLLHFTPDFDKVLFFSLGPHCSTVSHVHNPKMWRLLLK